MDAWAESTSQRHKRSFAEMSQGATLSPSPMNFGDRSSNLFSSSHYAPLPDNSQSSFRERRTPHPHNPPIRRSVSNMPEQLQNRSQVVIDLTIDDEDRPVAPRSRDRSHPHRPPHLDRSDAVAYENFIDLTDDVEPDVEITGGRRRPRSIFDVSNWPRDRSPPARHPPLRPRSPSLFMHHMQAPPPPPPGPRNAIERMFAAPGDMLGALAGFAANPRVFQHGFGNNGLDQLGIHVFAHDIAPQVMPGRMNYQDAAFAQRRAEHVPPPAAQEGFTRSPVEGDVVICPSCEEELIHRKDEEPIVKKNGKAPSRREREEHPFWVVRECGHVYCNRCFQNRTAANKTAVNVSFREVSKVQKGKHTAAKALGCAVNGCEADVKGKDKWVGVFL